MAASVEPDKVYLKFVQRHGLGRTHIKAYDAWIGDTISHNICKPVINLTSGYTVHFQDLTVSKPKYTIDGKTYPLTPAFAKRELLTYSGELHVTMVVKDKDNKVLSTSKNLHIATIPIMLRSIKCNLHNLSPNSIVACGDDPVDPGGYFIINGSEYVVMYLEKLALEKYIGYHNKKEKGDEDISITTLNESRKTTKQLLFFSKANKMVMMFLPSLLTPGTPRLQCSVNILHIVRLLGVEDVDTFIELVTAYFISVDPIVHRQLLDHLCDSRAHLQMYPDTVAVIASKLPNNTSLSKEEKETEVRRIIKQDVFSHLNYYFTEKAAEEGIDTRNYNRVNLIAYATAMLLERVHGLRADIDRDSWSNKRIEAASKAMEYLLRNAWHTQLSQCARIKGAVDHLYVKKIEDCLVKSMITDSFVTSFSTSKWGVKNKRTMKTDRTQFFIQDSSIYTLAMLDHVEVAMSRTDKQTNTRMVQESQYGFIDPVYCTEGKNTGLLKSISTTVQISPWKWGNDLSIIEYLHLEKLCCYVYDPLGERLDYVFVNAVYVGWGNGDRIVMLLRKLKLNGKIPCMTSVTKRGRLVSVHTSPFRLVRPLFVVDPDSQRPVYEVLGLDTNDPDELLEAGAIEFIDPEEQECAKIAPNLTVLKEFAAEEKRLTRKRSKSAIVVQVKRTRLEGSPEMSATETQLVGTGWDTDSSDGQVDIVDEGTDELGSIANEYAEPRPYMFSIPEEGFTDYQPRKYTHLELDEYAFLSNTSAMIPYLNHNQAPRNTYQISMGKQALGANMHRGAMKELAMPSDPIIKCSFHDMMGMKNRGPGQTLTVAMMCRPNNSEDGMVMKREFLERGGMMMVVKTKYKTTFRDVSEPSEMMGKPNKHYSTISESGLPCLGMYISQGQCVIGKFLSTKDDSIKMYCGEEGVVHDVRVTAVNPTTFVAVELRIVRNQIEGDKMAPRNAQKCTISQISREADLPRNLKKGYSPDVYVNTHCLPGRVTISYVMMIKASSIGCRKGITFSGDPGCFEEVKKLLGPTFGNTEHTLTMGLYDTLSREVTCGPVFFQPLRHHVRDKKMCRGQGKVHAVTRQPIKGKCWNGGLKFTEMECDASHSNGACEIVRERLMNMSDEYNGIFCATCGHMAEFDINGLVPCPMCKCTEYVKASVPYISQVISHMLTCCGVKLERILDTNTENSRKYKQYLKGSRNPRNSNYVQNVLTSRSVPTTDSIESVDKDYVYSDSDVDSEDETDVDDTYSIEGAENVEYD